MDLESEQHSMSPSSDKANGNSSQRPVMPDGMPSQVLRDSTSGDVSATPATSYVAHGDDVQHPAESAEETAADKKSGTPVPPAGEFGSAEPPETTYYSSQNAQSTSGGNENDNGHTHATLGDTSTVHAGKPSMSGVKHARDNREGRTSFRTAFFGVFGGCVGTAAVLAALYFGGFFNKPSHTYNNDFSNITIKSDDTNVPVAKAVASKVLPSVTGVRVSGGIGSGVVLDTEGHILTNYHVVADADLVSVLIGGKSYEAVVVGSDPSSDLSVLKADLKGDKVVPIEFADSSKVEVGDWVMSVGSPYGNDQSVSSGIVSALYRSTVVNSRGGSSNENSIYTNMIQTDAAINPGNSGGALVNDRGQLVGINTIIASKSGAGTGVGFAIPSNYVDKIAKQLVTRKIAVHAHLGVRLDTVDAFLSREEGRLTREGARIVSVTGDSPAAKAGLQKGDIITKFNDKPITSADALILAVRSREIGDTVTLEYTRGLERKSVQLVLGSDEAFQLSQHDALVNRGTAPEGGPGDLFDRLFQRNNSRPKNASNA